MANDHTAEHYRELRSALRLQPLRYLHILSTIILTLYGAGVLMITLTVKWNLKGYESYLDYYLDKPILVFITGSMVLIGLGCLGFLSSARTLYRGLVTFGVLLFGLLMFSIMMTVIAIFTIGTANMAMYNTLHAHVNNYTINQIAIDYIQSNLSCCGIDDFTDWNSTLGYIPGSCCGSESACGFADVENLSLVGCYDSLQELVNYFINFFSILLLALAALKITVIGLTYFLGSDIAHHRRLIQQRREHQETESDAVAEVNNPLGIKSGQEKFDERNVNTSVNKTPSAPRMSQHLDVHEAYETSRRGILRHPLHTDVTFRYNNPHEQYLSAAPQARYDRKHVVGK